MHLIKAAIARTTHRALRGLARRRFIGVVFLFIAGLAARAAEQSGATNVPSGSGQQIPVTQKGKIVAVDKKAKALLLEINGKIYRRRLNPGCKIYVDGRVVPFEDLVSGQMVSVATIVGSDGKLELVSIMVEAADSPSQPAGRPNPRPSPPFPPPPVNRPPVSPHN